MLHLRVHALAAGLDADDADVGVVEEGIEQAHRVGPAADGGDDRVGQTALGSMICSLGFLADDRLEIAHHGRVRVRPRDRADAVERVAHIGDPVAQRVVHRVLQRAATGGDRDTSAPSSFMRNTFGACRSTSVAPM
jgi:hypothetical protein